MSLPPVRLSRFHNTASQTGKQNSLLPAFIQKTAGVKDMYFILQEVYFVQDK